MNKLPGETVYLNKRRGLKRQNATVGFPKKPTSSTKKDQQQDRDIKRLKNALRVLAPPVKSRYGETVYNPENEWMSIGLPYPAKGGDKDERLGDTIDVKSINFRYTISVSETDNFDTFRCCIIQYMDGNTETNYPLNHLTNVWLQPTTDYPVLSPFNTQSASTYRVLFDKVYNVNENGVAQISENVLVLAKDMAITKIKFDTDAGLGLPALDRGLILMWICSDSSASPNPKIECTIKFNFTDT